MIEQATGTQVERQASGLAGKPAPDFQLDLLPGGTYRLSESRGKVIVLDFWASWCGPCMLSMPSLQLAMAEFNADRVQLVSVNIEEQPERIQQALQRLKWVQPVVLDRDGAVSRRFQIDALPQLVIIDARELSCNM
ncbi:MAG: TlpA disulfide reductase family protein [Planctomycetaceae bacterium]